MRILTATHAVPKTVFTNDDILRWLACEASAAGWSASDIERLMDTASRGFTLAGTIQRRYCVEGERPLGLLEEACHRAFAQADVDPQQIDFVIYAGVARGWLEPSMASVCQRVLATDRAESFDVLDACASWIRALQLAHLLIRSGNYRLGLICNCEAGFLPLAKFRLWRRDDFARHLTGFTVGEAATATIVAADSSHLDDYYFRFSSAGKHFDLCMIPLDGYQGFLPSDMTLDASPGTFFSVSERLVAQTVKRALRLVRDDSRLRDSCYDTTFGHQASVRVTEAVTKKLGLNNVISTHEMFGNTVAASVPLSMSVALADGRWQRGDRTIILVGSAGISVGIATFTF